MSATTAKEFLQQIRLRKFALKSEIKRLEELREMAEAVSGIRYDKTPVQTSGSKSGMPGVERVVDMETQLRERIMLYIDDTNRIVDMIDGLQDLTEARILRMRYVDGQRWSDIAESLCYTESGVYKAHGRALEHFDEAYKIG